MTQSDSKTVENGRSLVMRAAGLVGVAVLVSRVVGLVREMVTQTYLGTSGVAANAYAVANRFPEAIFFIVAGGAIGSAFIPTFAAYFADEDDAGGWRLFSAVINLLTLVVTGIAVVTAVFAPAFVTFFFREQISTEPEILPLAVQLMRIMLISPIIFGVSGVFMGALNARQHFLLPALAPTIYNLGIIAGAIFIKPPELGLAIGTVLGAVGHLAIQLPGLRQKEAKYTAVLTTNDPGVRQVLKLMAPRVLGLSFSQVNNFIILFLTGSSGLALGSLPALNVAFRITIMPQGVLGQALGIAAFPTLATLAAKSAFDEMKQIVIDSLRVLLFLGLPVTVLLMILSEPIIALLFERGLFDAESTQFAAWALLFYAIGLIPLIALEVIARTFYALSDTLTPVLAGGFQILLMSVLSYWFSQSLFPALGWLPLGGLAFGFSLSNILEVAILVWLLRRKMGGLNGRAFIDGGWRMIIAAVVMAAAMWGVGVWLETAVLLLQLIVSSAVGGVAYVGSCYLLRVKEVKQFIEYGRRRLGR
ncbi:MAG: murein biosynthesis integral membrane protein MurJ [Chloroflexi bacterium]|nr:murein biosynthesis integral membrane protein MurJ [Chloroflexota bacterium]